VEQGLRKRVLYCIEACLSINLLDVEKSKVLILYIEFFSKIYMAKVFTMCFSFLLLRESSYNINVDF